VSALAEIVIAILAGFLELLIHLIAFTVSSSFLAAHFKGMKRAIYVIVAFSALILALGLLLPFATGYNGYLLSPIFSMWIMAVSLAILFISILFISAIEISAKREAQQEGNEEKPAPKNLTLISYLLAIVILVGLFSIFSANQSRNSLKEELCAAASGKISLPSGKFSLTWELRGEKGMALAEKYLGRDVSGKLPCPDTK